MNRIIAILGLFLLIGCYNAPNQVKPVAWMFKQMPDNAPNNYKRGWIDGCESGLSSMTNTYYKTYYSFKMEPELRKDPTYYRTWQDTYHFCRHYAYGIIRQTDDRMNLPNQPNQFLTNFMGAQGIFEAGLLAPYGPGGTALLPFANFGSLGGSGELPMGIGGMGTLDYTDDYVLNGKRGGLTMDFNW